MSNFNTFSVAELVNGLNTGTFQRTDISELIQRLAKALTKFEGRENAPTAARKTIEREVLRANEFTIVNSRGANAVAKIVKNKYVVKAGSEVASIVPSARIGIIDKRNALAAAGVLDEAGKFLRDYAFESASGAAEVVSGGNSNGWTMWRHDDKSMDALARKKAV